MRHTTHTFRRLCYFLADIHYDKLLKLLQGIIQITDILLVISGQYGFKDLPLYSLRTKSGAGLVQGFFQ